MEFGDLKKVWDAQNERPLFVLDEAGLHKRIAAKMNRADRTANLSEWFVICSHIFTAGCLLITSLLNRMDSVWIYVLAAWMLAVAVYVVVRRIKRLRGGRHYDRSLRGDLTYAIEVASYQVRLSRWLRWGMIPAGVLIFMVLVEDLKGVWIPIGTLVLYALAYFLSGWEHNYYESRKRELEALQAKLENF